MNNETLEQKYKLLLRFAKWVARHDGYQLAYDVITICEEEEFAEEALTFEKVLDPEVPIVAEFLKDLRPADFDKL